jgi:hypothetical protein
MSKLAHSDDASMRRIESDRLLRDDPAMFRCCGCGLACPENVKPCDCYTGVGYRVVGGKIEHMVLVATPPKADFKVSLAAERRRIKDLEDLLLLIRDRRDCTAEIAALIDTAFQREQV